MKNKSTSTSKDAAQTVIVVLFVAVLLISNLVSTKLVGIPGINIIIDGGTILFPFAYILGDVITEVYGFRKARLAILCGFMSMIIMSLVVFIVQVAPPSQEWGNQVAYETILGIVPRIAIGSLAAYLVGEILNSYVMARMKVASQGKCLWMRAIGSTVVAALVDTAIFSTVAFYGVISLDSLLELMVTVYTIKILVEVRVLPITYKIVRFLKRLEREDYFDNDLSLKTIFKE